MKTGCIIQARNTSTRLPGKVLKTIDFKTGETILEEVIRRMKLSNSIDEIIVATTTNTTDDSIEALCNKKNVNCFRGSELDVLERYYLAAKQYDLDEVIRITSDCPFIDPFVVDTLIDFYHSTKCDYASNTLLRTFPHGLDCEIFRFDMLEEAIKETTFCDKDKFYREHVTTYFHTQPDKYKLEGIESAEDNSLIRITVDTKEDYTLTCVLKNMLKQDDVSYETIVKIFKDHPYLFWINDSIIQKKKYNSLEDELKDAIEILKKQELYNAAKIIEKEEQCL